MNRYALLILLGLVAGSPAPHAATAPAPSARIVDKGSFIVYQRDRVIGAETFTLEGRGDSLNVFSRAHHTMDVGNGPEELDKQMILIVQRDDYGLKMYQSNRKFRGEELIRGIVIGDTAFTIYREVDGAGEGVRYVLPPGRLFVMDSHLFTLFELICLSLRDKQFTTWPISMVTLGSRDSVLEATATHVATESVRWKSRPVRARKMLITDGAIAFTVWADPQGRMLRLEHPESGLRVERDPTPVNEKAPSTSPPSRPPPAVTKPGG